MRVKCKLLTEQVCFNTTFEGGIGKGIGGSLKVCTPTYFLRAVAVIKLTFAIQMYVVCPQGTPVCGSEFIIAGD